MDKEFWSNILWDLSASLCSCGYISPPLKPEDHSDDCCYRGLLQTLADRRLTITTAYELIVELQKVKHT